MSSVETETEQKEVANKKVELQSDPIVQALVNSLQ